MFLLLQSSEQKLKTSTNNTRVKMAFAGTLLGTRVCLKISIWNEGRQAYRHLYAILTSLQIQIREVKLSACVCMEQNTLLFEE